MNTAMIGKVQSYGTESRPPKDDVLESLRSQIANVREQARLLTQDRSMDADTRAIRRSALQEQLRDLGRQVNQRQEVLRTGRTFSRREASASVDTQAMQETLAKSKSTAPTVPDTAPQESNRPMFYNRQAQGRSSGEFMNWPPRRSYASLDVTL